MATQSTPSPLVTLEQEVLTNLHNKLHTIIVAHIGVLVLFIALVGFGGWLGLRSYDKQVERAEALQVQFEKSQEVAAQAQKQLADIIAADSAARAQETTKQQDIEKAMLQRAQTPPAPPVVEALKPSADAGQLKIGLEAVFAAVPTFGPVSVGEGTSVVLNQAQTQAVIVSRENELSLSLDLKDETALFTLEQAKTSSLNRDLTACQATVSSDKDALKKAQDSIVAYEKVAHQSKFRRVLGAIGSTAGKVVIAAVAFEIGASIRKP